STYPVCCIISVRLSPCCTLLPYTTLFRSEAGECLVEAGLEGPALVVSQAPLRAYQSRLDQALAATGWTIRWHWMGDGEAAKEPRSEEHTSELQSRENLVCRLLLEKKKQKQ